MIMMCFLDTKGPLTQVARVGGPINYDDGDESDNDDDDDNDNSVGQQI